MEREVFEVPDHLEQKSGLIIFNVEAGRDDDIMTLSEQKLSLRLLLGQLLGKGLGVAVLAPPVLARELSETFEEYLKSNLWVVATLKPHSLKLVNKANPD